MGKKSKRNMAVKKVEDGNRRNNVIFSKRRTGLFNKLTELSILCQAETALMISSPNDKKLYACGYPSADAVIRRFLTRGPPVAAAGNMNHDQEKLETLRAKYDAVQEQLNEEKEKKRNTQAFPFWWESPIHDMDFDGIQHLKKSLEKFMLNLVMRYNSTTTATQQQVMMMQNNCHGGSNSTDNTTVPLFPPQPDNCHGGWQQVENGHYIEFESGSTSSDHNTTSVTLAPFPPSFDCSSTSRTVMLTPPGGFGQFY